MKMEVGHCSDVAISQGVLDPPGAGSGRKEASLESSKADTLLLDFWPPEHGGLCCCEPYKLALFLQPQEANTHFLFSGWQCWSRAWSPHCFESSCSLFGSAEPKWKSESHPCSLLPFTL